MVSKTVVDGLAESNRRKSDRIQQRFDALIFGYHSREREPVFFREFGKFRAGTVQVAPLCQIGAVGKRHVKNRIGINVFETVIPELKLIVAQNRVSVNPVVRRRAHVVRESAQRQVRGFDPTTHSGSPFKHQAAITCFRQVSSRNQTVVPGASNDDVKSFSHGPRGSRSWFIHRLSARTVQHETGKSALYIRLSFVSASRSLILFPNATQPRSQLHFQSCSPSRATCS